MKRTVAALHLSRAPLVYVVGQVRFSAVMAIEKYVPDVQEQLRHKGFPRFERGQIQEIVFQKDGAPKFGALDRFEFQDKERTLGIVLQSNSVAVHTSKYSNYEAFEEGLKTALMAVHRAVKINLSERIGLRYVNLVRLRPGEKWSDYINRGLLGVEPQTVGVKSWTSRSEFLGQTEVGKLLVRCIQSEQPLPPDLLNITLQSSLGPEKGETVTTLDFDHFLEQSSDFTVSAAMSTFEQLHESLDKVFAAAVTSGALVKWGKEEKSADRY